MASTRRKAAAVALAVVGIAGLSLAAAAQLNITSTQLAAGSVSVTGCDTAVDVDYTVSGSTVTAVQITNILAACNGADYSVQLTTNTPSAGTALGTAATGTLTVTAGAATVTLPAAVSVAAVDGIAIVLS
jgi:hypothetical protein